VDESTRNVLIECAHFDPGHVRHTGRRLNLFTDASIRFERGVDAEGVGRAADRAARLMAELAGGEVSAGVVRARGVAPERCESIRLDPTRVNRLLGTDLSGEEIQAHLGRVGVEAGFEGDTLVCRIPSHRNDLGLPEDLVEEVARLEGYDRIPSTIPTAPLVAGRRPPAWTLADRVRDALEAEGLVELLSLPFLDPRDLDRLALAGDDPRRNLVRVLNPLVESESHLRSTLVPSFLRVVRENLSRQVENLGIFEVCRTFRRGKSEELPDEPLELAVALTQGEAQGPWQSRETVPLFFRGKGMAERLLRRLGYLPGFRPGSPHPYLHPGSACEVALGDAVVGSLGGLHPEVAARFGVSVPCLLLELDLGRIGSVPRSTARYREVSAYPSVRRDLAVLLDRDRRAGDVLEAIRREGGSDLAEAEIFDRYEGKGVPEGKVSLAFRLTFQRLDRTLTDAEVSRRVDRVVTMLAHRFGGTLRSAGEGERP
jgi:phenylalanyl-tRNA synthetase beta chain